MEKGSPKSNLARGAWGEEKACQWLENQEYTILDRNYKCKTGEIDIAAYKDGVLAFIEVKTRTRSDYGLPCQAVDRRKQRRLILSAQYYIKCHPRFSGLSFRMDIIEVLSTVDGCFIRHLENAFS